MFSNIVLCSHRARHESRKMTWGDIAPMEDESGRFLEFRERATKTRTGESKDARPFTPRAYENECNPARCPVELYHIYASHRPLSVMHDNAPFFLAVNNMLKHDNDPRLWFKVSPLGQNTIGSFMPCMAVEIGLKGKYTNHPVRKTSCTNLLQAGVSPTLIQQISGHKDVKSLTNYATASREQIHEMGAILSNPSRSNAGRWLLYPVPRMLRSCLCPLYNRDQARFICSPTHAFKIQLLQRSNKAQVVALQRLFSQQQRHRL